MKANNIVAASVVAAIALAATGCIDHDYDLNDVDMTIGIGGDHLTIPTSSTSAYTMDAILDLSDGSSIHCDADGNYVVEQTGTESNESIKIDVVKVRQSDPTTSTVEAAFPTMPANASGVAVVIGGTATGIYQSATNALINRFVVSNEGRVPTELISISKAWVTVPFTAKVSFSATDYSGSYTIEKGFTIDCGSDMAVTTTASYLTVEDGYKLVFNQDYTVNSGSTLDIPATITEITVSLPWGIQSDHSFSWENNITTTGTIGLDGSKIAAGTAPKIDITIVTTQQPGTVNQIIGCVNPEFTINESDFSIIDIPDFLSEDGNVLDIDNPCIYLTMYNGAPCPAMLDLVLTSYKDGKELASVTAHPYVATGSSVVCISEEAVSDSSVTSNDVVSNLGDLISTIPDKITYSVAGTHVDSSKEYTFKLGYNYPFTCSSKVYFPLAFGPDLKMTYSDDDTDWDLEDVEKLNFSTVQITAVIVNTIPIELTPELEPIYRSGMSACVDVDMHGCTVVPGTPESPSYTDLYVTLTGTSTSLMALDGVRYVFYGSNPVAGTALNKDQSITITDIKITLEGGLSYDAN